MSKMIKEIKIFGKATDPIYIGTGGYTIGRVDNTIVRDPISRVPKIPGSSLAGVWRYYSALYFQGIWVEIDDFWSNLENREDFKTFCIEEIKKCIKNKEVLNKEFKIDNFKKFILQLRKIFLSEEKSSDDFWETFWKIFKNYLEECKIIDKKDILNKIYEKKEIIKQSIYSSINCAGKDEVPQEEINEDNNTIEGHCGRCIVCKSFGYSKNSKSWQGILFFSDLEIILFPVYTQYGTKYVTTEEKIKYLADNYNEKKENGQKYAFKYSESDKGEYINLGWLNIKVEKLKNVKKVYKIKDYELIDNQNENNNENNNGSESNNKKDIKKNELTIDAKDIVIVPDKLFNQVVNSNLEVRTSVAIDPITGTSKDGALFTSEAIPRGTIFYGNIRIFDKSSFIKEVTFNNETVKNMLLLSKCYFESLGIGGFTTRGFGRMKVILPDEKKGNHKGVTKKNGQK